MTHVPNAEVLWQAANLRDVLRELEGEMRRTRAALRQMALGPSEGGRHDRSAADENITNTRNSLAGCGGDKTLDGAPGAVLAPLRALQKYVETCDAVIHDRLAHARRQVDLAANVSKRYQKMFPEHFSRISTTATPAASVTPDGSSTNEKHTPIAGKICHDDIKEYLSHFVRWEPLGMDRVMYASATATEGVRHSAAFLSTRDGSTAERTMVFPTTVHGAPSRGEGSQVSQQQTLNTQYNKRRSLNAVMDDLLMRQLQYDGITLTTAMEMNLGCYDRMTSGATAVNSPADVTLCDATIPQEVRRGIMQPPLDCDFGDDFARMVQNLYPRTAQWLAKIASHCGILAVRSLDGMSLEDIVETLLTSVADTSCMRQTSEHLTENENPEYSTLLAGFTSHEYRQEEDDEEEEMAKTASVSAEEAGGGLVPVRPLGRVSLARAALLDEVYMEEEEVEVFVSGADELLIYQALPERRQRDRPHYAADPPDLSVYTNEDEEGLWEGEEEEEREEEREEEEEEEEEEEREEGEEEETDEGVRAHLGEFMAEAEEHHQEEERQEARPNRGGAMKFAEEKEEKLEMVVAERVKIFLSDLLIICALQRLSQIVMQRKDETISATMRQAVNFTSSLQRHPLLAWRMAIERESQKARQGDGTAPQSLLLTFHHVFVALGYLPVALSDSQDISQVKREEECKENDGSSAHCAQKQLLACVAPFLHLWCGHQSGKSDRLVSVDVPCDADNLERNSEASPVLPTCTSPFVWRECVLVNLLDQIHKLRQLAELLVSDDTLLSSTAVTSSNPESLLYHLVYPLSTYTLRSLDEYYERGFFGSFDGPQPQPQQYTSSPPRRNLLFFLQSQQSQQPHQSHHHHSAESQQPLVVGMGSRRSLGMNQLRSFLGFPISHRFRRPEVSDEEAGSGDGESNNYSNSSATQRQAYPGPRDQRQHTIVLELPHASSILLQEDGLQRHATLSLLDVRGITCFYATNPTLVRKSYFVWQPMFQTTMCYCPVTRQRCLDASVCGIGRGKSQESPLSVNSRPGCNPAQLLTCGHVLSNRAIVAMLEQSRRDGRDTSASLRCVYCPEETLLEELVMLRYIY